MLLGYYCDRAGLHNVTGSCAAGAYCPTGSFEPAPITCPFGFHCPNTSSIPLPCTSGFYTNATGQSTCQPCPQGLYCLPLTWKEGMLLNESIAYKPCPRGYYCPKQTGSNWIPCPAGTFSNRTSLYDVSECESCSEGEYCAGDLRIQPNGLCSEGYYCRIGKILVSRNFFTFESLKTYKHCGIKNFQKQLNQK